MKSIKLVAPWLAMVHLLALASQAQTTEANPPKPTGTISGQLTSASGDLPSNTTIYVSQLGVGVPPRTSLPDTSGTFKIDGLEVGAYRVWANAPGFVSDSPPVTSDNRGIYHTGDSVNLSFRKGGVITGKIINSNNTPVVAATVRAFRVRDEDGKPIEAGGIFMEGLTDDRGIYRIFGLMPGTYVVSAGGMVRFFSGGATIAYDQDVPTYAPSSTRDTATELIVRSGEETIADIQYRGEPGHSVSGTIDGLAETGFSGGGNVGLSDVNSRTLLASTFISLPGSSTFVFFGLPDGEYELVAQQYQQTRDIRASDPKRIIVRGADVVGISLTLAPLPAISGRVFLETTAEAECVKSRATTFQETVVMIRRQKPPAKANAPEAMATQVPVNSVEMSAEAVPDTKGEFVLRNLRAGIYRLNVQLPSKAWYLHSLSLGANASATESRVITEGITLSRSVSGLSITISEGAAGIRGSVYVAEGQKIQKGTFVYLTPAEKNSPANLLRYFEASVGSDGRFVINNVAPGDYFIVALKTDMDRTNSFSIAIREDSTLRTAVTREAEKLKQNVTLKPCERLDNFELSYPPENKP